MQSVYFKTLGCKVNSYDTNALANQFRQGGYTIVEEPEQADVSIVNTCSVTENADKEARYIARRIRRSNANSLIVATGCYAQTDSAKLSELSEIDLVVPNEVKDKLVEFVTDRLLNKTTEKLPAGVMPVSENKQKHFKSSLTLFDEAHSAQTRAFVKIQDGCNGFCSYCLIPYARGASRSVEPALVLAEITRLVQMGTKEIVITGIHVGDYGSDFEGEKQQFNFTAMLQQILTITGLERLRISSLEPSEINVEMVELLANHPTVVCDHFHLPLQSGCNKILKMMRRTYTTEEYAATVALLRRHFPTANIGADVIPGFPGETEDDFQETCDYIRKIGLSYLHVFPYSKRPNTSAARMPNHLDPAVVKNRAARLREISAELQKVYTTQFIGSETKVLWEEKTNDRGQRFGLTSNYLKVMSAKPQHQAGEISVCHLHGFANGMTLMGSHT